MSNFLRKEEVVSISFEAYFSGAPFQQWGLDFIGEIHPTSSGQHKWILTATDYFTKWIEVVPTRQAIDVVIIQFLENNIFSRFGCPRRIMTDNATTFKSKRMIKFCEDYNIMLSHSTSYYPQGNGLVESSNKILIRIIKKLLQENKKAWHKKLIFSLWEDIISLKKSIGTSPFQLVYGTEVVFPTSLGLPVMKLLQNKKQSLVTFKGGSTNLFMFNR
jgi:transposase InsO family protein